MNSNGQNYNFRNDFTSDFEAMLARKKEETSRRRKRRDIDIINDNDDIIDQLIQNMRAAAEVWPMTPLTSKSVFFSIRILATFL